MRSDRCISTRATGSRRDSVVRLPTSPEPVDGQVGGHGDDPSFGAVPEPHPTHVRSVARAPPGRRLRRHLCPPGRGTTPGTRAGRGRGRPPRIAPPRPRPAPSSPGARVYQFPRSATRGSCQRGAVFLSPIQDSSVQQDSSAPALRGRGDGTTSRSFRIRGEDLSRCAASTASSSATGAPARRQGVSRSWARTAPVLRIDAGQHPAPR